MLKQLWFDALVAAGLDVDLCRVVEKNTKNVNAEKEKQDRKEKREKRRQQNQGTKKKKKAQAEEHDSEGEDYMHGADDADYRSPESVDDDSPRIQTRGKRHRDDDDNRDDSDSYGVLAVPQDKVASREDTSWPSDVSGNSFPRKRTKFN